MNFKYFSHSSLLLFFLSFSILTFIACKTTVEPPVESVRLNTLIAYAVYPHPEDEDQSAAIYMMNMSTMEEKYLYGYQLEQHPIFPFIYLLDIRGISWLFNTNKLLYTIFDYDNSISMIFEINTQNTSSRQFYKDEENEIIKLFNSPKKSSIIALSFHDFGRNLFFLNNSGAKTNEKLVYGLNNNDIKLSPDEKTLLFPSQFFGFDWDIFNLEVLSSSNDPKNLSNDPDHDELSPCWSPDGTHIVYISRNRNIYGSKLIKMEVSDPSNKMVIREDSTSVFYEVAWSPDGEKFAVTSVKGESNGATSDMIFTIYEDGSNLAIYKFPEGSYAQKLKWFPESKQFVFIYYKLTNQYQYPLSNLAVLNDNCTGFKQLTNFNNKRVLYYDN